MGSPHKGSTLYFGYGSNLWLHQMKLRCPSSTYLGVARLPNYRWHINERGYANVASSPTTPDATTPEDEVYGLVYSLTPSDEARLDKNEGVPHAYNKENIPVQFWPSQGEQWVDVTDTGEAERREMLVYIDRNRTEDDVPKEEYIDRMNKGIRDAVKLGVPQEYVTMVLRGFIPTTDKQELNDRAEKLARLFDDDE